LLTKNSNKVEHVRQKVTSSDFFQHTATVVLHSRTRFSKVPYIIPASQVLSKTAIVALVKQQWDHRLAAETAVYAH
jgi:hypothetical protein